MNVRLQHCQWFLWRGHLYGAAHRRRYWIGLFYIHLLRLSDLLNQTRQDSKQQGEEQENHPDQSAVEQQFVAFGAETHGGGAKETG